ncbi:MCE family protein [Nocardioides sp.]|uniref:MCE family protein n=1 Tax=Nocardioides sp. TaxID=35761 RepID=UPI0035166443
MSARARLHEIRQPLSGLVFLLVIVGLLVAAVVDYQGGFTSRTRVTLLVPDAGTQLSVGAQVKLHGAVVGTVDEIRADARGAVLTLALRPEDTDLIPVDTVARILPKTLVGQDYVDLVTPVGAGGPTVTEGSVIQRDTSATAATLEGALDDLFQVLQVLPADQVASTLNALSGALEGRGEQLGTTLVSLQDYLARLNPALPTLTDDLRDLATLSTTYTDAAPDLLQALEDFSVTARTVTEQRQELAGLFQGVRTAGDDLDAFLRANEDNLIRVAGANRTALTTLARYAPEYPCLLSQLAGLVPKVDDIFAAGTDRPRLSITARVTNSRGAYRPNQDEPAYADDRGPRCYPIKDLAPQYPENGGPFADGTVPPETRAGLPTSLPGSLAGSDAETGLLEGLLGLSRTEAPFAPLLLGPALRGTEVTVR